MISNYINISSARDLKGGKQFWIYKALEIIPGFLAWGTLIVLIFLSWRQPIWVAFFIIVFDMYWLLKVIFLSIHQRSAFNKMQEYLKTNWLEKLTADKLAWQDIYHLVLLPRYKEDYDIVSETILAISKANYPKEKIVLVLAFEERAGNEANKLADRIKQEFGDKFFKFMVTYHPDNILGELAGKGSNIAYSARQVKLFFDEVKIDYANVVVSAFDIDTRVYPEYFGCLTYHYLITPNRTRSSFQPIPIYNNNIWQAPFFSRVVATSATFWHMMQQERPERLATFSSHAHSFKALADMDFWPVGNVSEDSRIFWRALLTFNGDYRTVPIYYPVSMDANLAPTFSHTALNLYKQQRRWGWGVENVPYFLYGGLKNKKIPKRVFWKFAFVQLEGFWSWSTNALIIFMLGWLPLYLGDTAFHITALAANLPFLTRVIMNFAMIGMLTSAIYSLKLLPPRPADKTRWSHISIFFQWLCLPFTIILLGAFPGIEAQTRLMLGKYMGFWVTEKHRK